MNYIPKEKLVEGREYRLYYNGNFKEIAVFKWLGQTGMPIFNPIGEPSFEDSFGLEKYGDLWEAREL